MTDYSEDVFKANGNPYADSFRERQPVVSQEAKDFILSNEDLPTAVSDLADLFRIPLTSNYAWFENDDINKPVYHFDDFMNLLGTIFYNYGWTPPEGVGIPEQMKQDKINHEKHRNN